MIRHVILSILLLCTHLFGHAQVFEQSISEKNLLVNNLLTSEIKAMDTEQLSRILLPQLWNERDSLLRLNKVTEAERLYTNYYYLLKINDLSKSLIDKLERSRPWFVLADSIFLKHPLPTENELKIEPYLYEYLDAYIDYKVRELFLEAREKGRKEGDDFMLKTLGYPESFLKNASQLFGDLSLGIIYADYVLPATIAPLYLAHNINHRLETNELQFAKFIFDIFESKHPNHPFLADISKRIHSLEEKVEYNLSSSEVVILPKDGLDSLQNLLIQFRGKVIYLDIWGTWCGPCIYEMKEYTPALKAHFADEKDLVFLYIAMEYEGNDKKWRDFISLHSIKGVHMMRSTVEMEVYWEELLGTTNVPRSYPTYVIIDRNGKLVTTKALRPSDGRELYQQLENTLRAK